MKTIKVFSLLAATSLLTMSMGFPTDLAEVKATKKADTRPEAKLRTVAEVTPGKALVVEAVVEDEPVQQSMPMYATSDKITVKVFDVKGALVLKQEVAMNEFLGQNKQIDLAGKSTFVMFHANTAYYFLEAAAN
jgi:uncharacterized membrane protein